MAVRIQLRRDTAANWSSTNPLLYPGEFGIETDTLKIKMGPLVTAPTVGTAWNSITQYVNLVPDGNSTIGDYVLVSDINSADGVAGLDSSGNLLVPGSNIKIEGATDNTYETTLQVTDPTADRTITFKNADGTVAFVADIPTTTDSLTEGSTNKYFTDERAQDAVATALAAGTHTNISVSYNDAGNAISLTGAQTYNDENAQDAIGNNLGTGLSYNDTTGAISVDTSTIQARVANVTDTEIGYLDGVTSAIQTQIDIKAPLASPTLTGTPTAPTAAAATNTTQVATTAFVRGEVTALVNGASAALDTLGELAAALTADEATAATLATLVGTKAPIASPTFTGTVSGITKSMIGLGNVDNTTDAAKPISTATQTALDLKAPLASPTFTGTVSGITKSMVGLGNVDNTTDAGKPVSTATQTALDLKAPLFSPTFTGTVVLPLGTVTSSMILDGTILDADINASAAIALSKLATDPLARANHTGSQTASTISDFNEAAQDAVGAILGSGLTYTDASNTITVDSSVIQLRVSGVTDTEIGYLDGVTSAIQTQLGDKAPLSSPAFTGTVSAADLTLSGNLTVNGTTTNLNTTNLVIEDKNIVLGDTATPTDITADGGGITLKGATDKTFNWVDATDAWTSSEHVNLASGKSLYLNGTLLKNATETLTNKTLTSPVINTPTGITKSDVGLANVDNTTDAGKPVSTATQTALDLKAPLASPTFTGTVTIPSGSVITGVPYLATANTFTGGVQQITTASAATTGLIVKGSVSQSANLQEWQNSAGTVIASISYLGDVAANGSIYTNNAFFGGAASYYNATINIRPQQTSYKGIVIQARASQTGNLQEWQDSAGSILSKIESNGAITAPSLTLSSTALATTSGGTGLTSYTTGDLLYSSATNTLSKLAAGTDGYILTLASGVPSWAAAPITLPSQTGNSGKYLTTNGTSASWGTLVVPITTGTATVSANTATTVDTTALSAFTSIEYMVSLKQGSKVRTSKVVVQTDGTSVDMTEFAITETGGTIAGVVVSAAVSSTNAVLQLTATDATSTNVTVKFSKVSL